MTNSFIPKNVENARAAYQPLFSTIEITQACNFVCKHCYNFDREQAKQSPYLETLDDHEIKDAIRQLAQAGALYLNITGGEPLLHPSHVDIIRHAKKESFYVRLKTNASLISEKKAVELYDNGLDAVDVSLYGASEETYGQFTKRTQFKQVVEGLENCQKAGLEVTVSLILHRHNVHELQDMIDLCQRKNWHFLMSDEITDRYDQTKAGEELSITDQQFSQLLTSNEPYSESFDCDNQDKEVRCSCAQTVCAIAANGDIYPCIGAPIKAGNIKQERFSTIWSHSPELNKIRNLSKEDFKECTKCPYIEHCSRSSGSAYINTGDYTACDPLAFKRAQVRAQLKSNI